MARVSAGRRWRSAAVFVALLAMGALPPATSRSQPRSKPQTHHVIIDGTSFTPATLHIRAGDRVTWVNQDPFPHTATSRPAVSAEDAFDSKEIGPGRSWTRRFTRKSEAPYTCTLHPTMAGVVLVE